MTNYPDFDAAIPIVCFVLVNVLWSGGIFPLTFVLIPEIVPSNVRLLGKLRINFDIEFDASE